MTNRFRSTGMACILAAAAPLSASAQQVAAGRVVGRVVDAETGQPLSGTQIVITGTTLGTLSRVDGRYTLLAVPPGNVSLTITCVGYGEKTIEGVTVRSGEAVQQDISMVTSAISIDAITVTAARERGTVSAALNEQRSAVGMMSATTSEQIAKSPDSDAAQAVQRVSGVTVRDGKYVFVRGLGERYTTTSLNGARVPSPEPEKKVVPLDLFPSNLLEAITTSKTFTPDQPGDFSGAQVNLRTKSFPGRRMVQVSLGGGANSLATGQAIPRPATSGLEWLGFAASDRKLPSSLTSTTDFTKLTQGDINSLIRSFPRDWTFSQANGNPNVSGSISLGGEDPIFGHRLGYVALLSYSRSQVVRQDEITARAVPADASGTPEPYNEFRGSTGVSSVLWGGLLNLSTYIGGSSKIEFHNTYDRTADNEAHGDWGTLEEFQQVDSVQRTSMRYIERSVRSSQLRGEHELNAHNKVDWSLTSSGVSRVEPDRSDLAYGYEFAPTGERLPLAWLGFIPEAAKRTTSDLKEDALDGAFNYTLSVGPAERETRIRLGGDYRQTKRDAYTASYNLRALGLSASQRAAPPNDLFFGSFTDGTTAKITLEPNSSGGTYDAKDEVAAGFAMLEFPLGSRIRVVGGARVERWTLDMDAEPASRALINITRTNTDVLPSIAVNTRLSDRQTLRLSASQTLARPEYRELAPISYRDMLGDREVFGDSSLVRTLVQNLDARWEFYPDLDEVISIGVFAKKFLNPIEPIDVATSGVSQLSFTNAESATNYGVEVEVRKGLGFIAAPFQPISLFTNFTLMHSRINTSNSNLSALTNDERSMVGQAPYVVNAGLSYSADSGRASATLLYNVVGRRIASAAVTPVAVDTYEQPQQLLDFSFRFPLYGSMNGRFDARNLLDAAHEELQGEVIRYRYRMGRSFRLGLSWSVR